MHIGCNNSNAKYEINGIFSEEVTEELRRQGIFLGGGRETADRTDF